LFGFGVVVLALQGRPELDGGLEVGAGHADPPENPRRSPAYQAIADGWSARSIAAAGVSITFDWSIA
jgi:hypothetical protein